jgi:hypothetical protein
VGSVMMVATAGSGAARELEAEKVEARKVGMPLDFADLKLEKPAEDKNAAIVYFRVEHLLKGKLGEKAALMDRALRRKATPEDKAAGDAAVSDMKPAFDLLDTLDRYPSCAFARDWSKGPALLFPEFAGMKRDVKDLCYRSDWQSRNGDWPSAVKGIQTSYRVSQDAGTDPILISMLVRVACHAIATHELTAITQAHANDPAYLEAASALLKQNLAIPDIKSYLKGEIVMTRTAIQMAQSMRDFTLVSNDETPGTPSTLEK